LATGKRKRKKKISPQELNKALMEDKDWIYYKKVEAHRTYMYAMSLYKHLKYGKKQHQYADDRGLTKA